MGQAIENYVQVLGLRHVEPAEFDAQWNGHPIRIALDLSATLHLLGNARDPDKAALLSLKSDIVSRAAKYLIDAGLEKPHISARILVSAIDLEIGASARPVRGDQSSNMSTRIANSHGKVNTNHRIQS